MKLIVKDLSNSNTQIISKSPFLSLTSCSLDSQSTLASPHVQGMWPGALGGTSM